MTEVTGPVEGFLESPQCMENVCHCICFFIYPFHMVWKINKYLFAQTRFILPASEESPFTSLIMKHSTHDYFGGSRNLSGLNEHENCLCYLLLALRKTDFVAEITDYISQGLFKDRPRCTRISDII